MKKALVLVVIFVLLFGGGYSVFANNGHGAPDNHQHANTCRGADISYCSELNDPESDIFPPEDTTCICNPLQTESFTGIVNNILTILFNFALVLTPLMVVVAGVMFVTAGGSPDRISTAKRILLWTGIGFMVILLAKGLIAVIRAIIGF